MAREQLEGVASEPPADAEQAVGMVLTTSPELEGAVAWCRAHAEELTRIDDPVRQVQLAWLGALHGAAVDPLLTLLVGPEPALDGGTVVADLWSCLKKGETPAELPRGDWKTLLLAWLDTAWVEKAAARKLALSWLPLALPVPFVRAYTTWWRSVAEARRAVVGFVSRTSRGVADGHTVSAHGVASTRLSGLEKAPGRYWPHVVSGTWSLARAGVSGADGMAWLAVRRLSRPTRIVDLWAQWGERPRAARLLSRVGRDVARDPSLGDLWGTNRDGPWWGPALEALEHPDPVGAWRLVVELHRDPGLEEGEVDLAIAVHAVDPSRARARVVALKARGLLAEFAGDRVLKLAGRAAGDDGERFADTVALLLAEDDRVWELVRFVGSAAAALARVVGRKPLVDASSNLALARVLGLETAPWPGRSEAPLPPELQRYPVELYPQLAWLAAVHPSPAKGAAAVLDRHLPHPRKLQAQLEVLRRRNDPALASRIARLEQWLASPPELSSVRRAKLQEKLEAAAFRATFEAWSSHLHEATSAACAARWGRQPRLHDPRTAAILGGVARLDTPFRALVDRMLERRNGPRPWDLRDDPVHVELLERWRARGIDPGPWLDPPESTLEVDGASLRLAVTVDPLDTLWMGGAFDTCLSPHSFNFFSAVTNAADIDKHVVAAWRGEEMVARCLVVVDDVGALLTFQPYGAVEGFADAVGAWVDDLAKAMGTVVATAGTVKARLGPRWYDDGVVDIAGTFRFLAVDEDFVRTHGDASPEHFAARVQERLGPLHPALARALLGTPALRKHPRWVLGLLPWLDGPVDPVTAQQLATLLARAERADLAWPYARKVVRRLPREMADGAWVEPALLELWVERDPVAAQRALRRSYLRNGQLRYLWVRALRALGREQQAARVQAGGNASG